MVAFIEAGEPALAGARAALAAGDPVAGARLRAPHPAAHAARLPHVPRAHRALAEALGLGPDAAALVRGARVLQGPARHGHRAGGGDPLAAPTPSSSTTELEIACVIGDPGRDIARDDWREHVFGWTIWNDMSARDTQTRELPLGMGPGQGQGLGRLERARTLHRDGRRVRRGRRRDGPLDQRRGAHPGPLVADAPHLRRPARLRLTGLHPAAGRGDRVGHGARRRRHRDRGSTLRRAI